MKNLILDIKDTFNAFAKAYIAPKATLVTKRFQKLRLEQIHDAEGELQRENEITSLRWYEARRNKKEYSIVECTRTSPQNGLLNIEPYTEKAVQLKGGKTSFDGYDATKILSELEYNLSKTRGWTQSQKQPLSPLSYTRKSLEF